MSPPEWVGPVALAVALFNLAHTGIQVWWGYRPPMWCLDCNKRQRQDRTSCKRCGVEWT